MAQDKLQKAKQRNKELQQRVKALQAELEQSNKSVAKLNRRQVSSNNTINTLKSKLGNPEKRARPKVVRGVPKSLVQEVTDTVRKRSAMAGREEGYTKGVEQGRKEGRTTGRAEGAKTAKRVRGQSVARGFQAGMSAAPPAPAPGGKGPYIKGGLAGAGIAALLGMMMTGGKSSGAEMSPDMAVQLAQQMPGGPQQGQGDISKQLRDVAKLVSIIKGLQMVGGGSNAGRAPSGLDNYMQPQMVA